MTYFTLSWLCDKLSELAWKITFDSHEDVSWFDIFENEYVLLDIFSFSVISNGEFV